MDNTKFVLLALISSTLLAASPVIAMLDVDMLKSYHLTVRRPDGMPAAGDGELSDWHASLLASVCNASCSSRLVRSCGSVVSGFSAWLSEQEVAAMARREWFVEAVPAKPYKLMTSRTPKPLRLHNTQHDSVRNTSSMGEGIVIGVLDDGIDAGHPSFGDKGMPPAPAKWRGRCKYSGAVCSNKLIGARTFMRQNRGYSGESTHGTHASSIAAGASVRDAAGVPGAVVSGTAPRAHLAFYQACTAQGCSRGPIMHAIEKALADGVDVLSLSLGDDSGLGFDEDPVFAATFSAVMKGVFVCAAGGNNGPTPGSITNDAPWMLTVGASSQSSLQSITIPAFSSRGPSYNNGGILKPDILGPGVDILAAVPRSTNRPSFGHLSGTSMSAPHLSGVAALIKSEHPAWSPAAIKSAIMTTADTSDNRRMPFADETGRPASYFAMGAGHVNPAKAIDPGLVYDISTHEYIPYLCGLGYSNKQVNRIIYPAPAVNCAVMENTEAKDLNYPSIMVTLTEERPVVTIRRTVTNVGAADSMYRVNIGAPKGVCITVNPRKLQFDKVNQKTSFTVTVKRASGDVITGNVEGQLKWVSEKHVVRSPISISA